MAVSDNSSMPTRGESISMTLSMLSVGMVVEEGKARESLYGPPFSQRLDNTISSVDHDASEEH